VATISVTDRYGQLLEEIRIDHEQTVKNINKFVNSAKYRIPSLCEMLQNQQSEDGIKLSNQEIRNRIYQDCGKYWERETIRKAFPDSLLTDFTGTDRWTPEGFVPYGSSGMMIPVDDSKYFNQKLEETVISLKRNFRFLVKEAQGGEDIQRAFSDYCWTLSALKNIKWYIENVGKQYKLQLVDPTTDQVKQLRKPISVYNLNFPLHEELKPVIDEIREKKDLYVKQLDNLVDSMYKYPIMSIEDANYINRCFTSLLIESYQAVNFKSSQTLGEMFETDHLTVTMTEKQAGKNSKTKTLVCKVCLRGYTPETDDPPIVEIDRGSSSGFRCPNCLGMEVCERGLTKDIVMQRKPFLEKVADHVQRYPPMDAFSRFGSCVKSVLTGTRKTLASSLLKQSHFGSTNDGFKKI
jgi:hypothetical protein